MAELAEDDSSADSASQQQQEQENPPPPPEVPDEAGEESKQDDPVVAPDADGDDEEVSSQEQVPDRDVWATLMESASFPAHSIAQQLLDAHADAGWETMLAPFRNWSSIISTTPYDPRATMFRYADSPACGYFLIIKGGNVQVMFGLRRCHPLPPTGQEMVAALIGERQWRAGSAVHPPMFSKTGAPNRQQSIFESVTKRAVATEALSTAFQADPPAALVQQPTDPAAATITAFPALPIHPKLASFYMGGMSIRAAFLLTEEIVQLIPAPLQPDAQPWRDFMHVGAVAAHATGPGTKRSCLATTWTRVDHLQNREIEAWYYSHVDVVAKVPAPPARSPGRPARSPGSTDRPEGSSHMESLPEARQFFTELVDRIGSSSHPAPRQTKRYEWHEQVYIFERCGAPTGSGETPYSGLSTESLPLFFQELESVRGPSSNTRSFLENFRTTHYPADKTQYQFTVTTQLIKDVRALSFNGNDTQCLYDNRHKGLGVFSLAPLSEALLDPKARERMIQYELTSANHGLAEAAAMAKQAVIIQSIPGNRHETYAWVEHVNIKFAMLLGSRCPLNEFHILLLDALSLVADFVYWTADDWRAFVWLWHRAVRMFMDRTSLAAMRTLTSDMQSGRKPDHSILPPEMRTPVLPSASLGNDASKRKGDEKPPPGNKKQGGTSISSHFASAIQSARGKTKTTIRAGLVIPNDEAAREVLGAEFYSLLPSGQEPCTRHFIFGKCNGCSRAHKLSRTPSQALLKGISQRLQPRLDSLVAKDPK